MGPSEKATEEAQVFCVPPTTKEQVTWLEPYPPHCTPSYRKLVKYLEKHAIMEKAQDFKSEVPFYKPGSHLIQLISLRLQIYVSEPFLCCFFLN